MIFDAEKLQAITTRRLINPGRRIPAIPFMNQSDISGKDTGIQKPEVEHYRINIFAAVAANVKPNLRRDTLASRDRKTPGNNTIVS